MSGREWRSIGGTGRFDARARDVALTSQSRTTIADVGLLAWVAMAALAPERLPLPASIPILTAGYEGFTGGSWQDHVTTSPVTADYSTLLFRMYRIYGAGLSLRAIAIAATGFRHSERWAWWALLVGNAIGYGAAMVYDQIVGAIGPLELSEYLSLAAIYGSLAVTAPFRATT